MKNTLVYDGVSVPEFSVQEMGALPSQDELKVWVEAFIKQYAINVQSLQVAGEYEERFDMGKVVINSTILWDLSPHQLVGLLVSHHIGKWGDVPEDDAKSNEESLVNGWRIVSHYKNVQRAYGDEVIPCNVMVITEGDRSRTSVFFSDEY